MVNWIKNLFKPAQKRIWKNVKREYLRSEDHYVNYPPYIETVYVYAQTQKDLLTGETRIFETRHILEVKEYDFTQTS